MAQLSIFEKQRHHSHRDFTCSVGKFDMVYMTFRNYSWKRFTNKDEILIYVKDRVIKFADPVFAENGGAIFKLKKPEKGYPSTQESTRYVQINGKKYRAILEIVRRTAGSYDFPKAQTKDEVKAEKAQLSEMSAEAIKSRMAQAKKNAPKPEELAEQFKPDLSEITDDRKARLDKLAEALKGPVQLVPDTQIVPLDVPKPLSEQFIEDVKRLTTDNMTPEERTAIYNALVEIYRLQAMLSGPRALTIKPVEVDKNDKWDIP